MRVQELGTLLKFQSMFSTTTNIQFFEGSSSRLAPCLRRTSIPVFTIFASGGNQHSDNGNCSMLYMESMEVVSCHVYAQKLVWSILILAVSVIHNSHAVHAPLNHFFNNLKPLFLAKGKGAFTFKGIKPKQRHFLVSEKYC